MKARKTNQKFSGVSVVTTVKITATPEETTELRRALAVVDRFRKAAFKAAKAGKDADWTEVGFAVKTDAVVVTVEQGMAG